LGLIQVEGDHRNDDRRQRREEESDGTAPALEPFLGR
jgi:hypothetical protein